jgi:hypothetical protein
MKDKYFDKSEAIGAMYELKKQEYTDIKLHLLSNGELALMCRDFNGKGIPSISIDEVESWCNYIRNKKDAKDVVWWQGLLRYDYWWIFD